MALLEAEHEPEECRLGVRILYSLQYHSLVQYLSSTPRVGMSHACPFGPLGDMAKGLGRNENRDSTEFALRP